MSCEIVYGQLWKPEAETGNKGGDHYYEATAGMGNARFVVVMLDICDQSKQTSKIC